MPKQHAILGASSSKIWMTCSAAAGAMGKGGKPSEYAALGSAAHELAEMCLVLGDNPQRWKGREVLGFEVDQDMIDAVSVYVNYVRKLDIDGVKTEVRVTLDGLYDENPPTPLFGTCDAMGIREDVLYVIDYKHGSGVEVDPVWNTQAMYYATGALTSLDLDEYEQVKTVRIVIVQPRLYGKESIKVWDVSKEELMEWAEDVLKIAIHKAIHGPIEYQTGEHCRFCPKLGNCEAQRELAQTTAKVDFDDPISTPPTPGDLSNQQIANILENAEIMRGFLKAVEGEAINRMAKEGQQISGFKVVKTVGRRHWAIPDADLYEKFGDEILKPTEVVSPAAFEQRVGKTVYKTEVAPYVNKVSSGVTIAPVTDSREEIVSMAKHDFDD